MEAPSGFEPLLAALQAAPLPLGYGAQKYHRLGLEAGFRARLIAGERT